MRDAVRRVDRDKARVDFVKRYSDLYGAYTEAEVIYTDDVAMALYGACPRRIAPGSPSTPPRSTGSTTCRTSTRRR